MPAATLEEEINGQLNTGASATLTHNSQRGLKFKSLLVEGAQFHIVILSGMGI